MGPALMAAIVAIGDIRNVGVRNAHSATTSAVDGACHAPAMVLVVWTDGTCVWPGESWVYIRWCVWRVV